MPPFFKSNLLYESTIKQMIVNSCFSEHQTVSSKLEHHWGNIELLASMQHTMATHSSTLAQKIPWMEEPGGLQSMGSRRVGHN